jgi:carbonic anhydrase
VVLGIRAVVHGHHLDQASVRGQRQALLLACCDSRIKRLITLYAGRGQSEPGTIRFWTRYA